MNKSFHSGNNQNISDTHLDVSEIFYTIQGEGPDLGMPIIFIRLNGCNLSCYFCDTAYTWNWEGSKFDHWDARRYSKKGETNWMSVSQVMQELKKVDPNRLTDLVVITGGNPLIHQRRACFKQLLEEMVKEKYIIEVEDNGTIIPADYIPALGIKYYHITPKTENSKVQKNLRDRSTVMKHYVDLSNGGHRVVFKYVISIPEDFDEVCALIDEYNIPRKFVWMMPEGMDMDALMEKSYWLIDKCRDSGFNFTPRLHIMAWGNVRGV